MDTDDRDTDTEKSAEKPKVLRAKPVKGEVDHAALSREHIARFPKIRVALARAEERCKAKDAAESANTTDEIIARCPTTIKLLGES